MMLRVLIVGGYGIFGGRIVELLKDEPRLELIVAGRSPERAKAFCAQQVATARLVPAVFDRNGDLAGHLATLRPDLLVDASGPYQAYGEGRYRVIEACIAAGVPYLDLADGAEFVDGVQGLDAEARAAQIFVLSGVSSFPVLTAAATRRLASGLARVESIRAGIAPSPYAIVGENVIRAITGYAGQPTRLRRDGQSATGYPFTEQMRFTIAPPGRVPVRNTLFSLVEVPDLRVLAPLWPEARTIWMGAGPVPESLHRALIALAWLVRWRVLPSLLPMAPLVHWVSNHVGWGEHRGGMFVEVDGVDAAGRLVIRSWHLLADGDDGPLIPSMAVEAIVRRMLEGQRPAVGARAAVHDLELEDYDKLFACRAIRTGLRDETDGPPLYGQVLGASWGALPAAVRAMHDGATHAVGSAQVERGTGWLSRLVGALIGFPASGKDVPLRVDFAQADDGETWTRTFDGRSFSSRQYLGSGRWERLLCERFGPLTFAMALVPEDGRMHLVLRGWTVLGVPMPMWLCPRSASYEEGDDRFRFHVEISHPLTGLIVRYRGWLEAR
ncbi:MAG: DUF4166 domain-containing protein [Reyranella sp.]|uniref:SDR family oxidoreductase n=1 Tax=Reyranella sp. TaxID=1929291 RepID=UPI001ACEFF88|nr:SDR family oxidoreductase [Reyranella sp.]MBN9088490.1 DUF4166 domain-containing protein [Reyranella sp.]